jgi:tRNA threonylcarbamoyladenosine biosynthesis protein TsaE
MATHETITIISPSEERTIALAARLAGILVPGDVVTLEGELGAGKTRFVRGLAIGLGHDAARVSSPTFVIAHVYDTPGARAPLVHADAYRMHASEDLDMLGWDRMADGTSIVAVEWPSRLPGVLTGPRFDVRLLHTGEDERRIEITPPPERAAAVLAAMKPRTLRCPTCGGTSDADRPTAPFCSDRCRMADLHKWFSGDYKITRAIKDSDLETTD